MTGVILPFELSLLTVAFLLLDIVVTAHWSLSLCQFMVALSRTRFATKPLAIFQSCPLLQCPVLSCLTTSIRPHYRCSFVHCWPLLSSAPTRGDSINNGNRPRSRLPLTTPRLVLLTGQHKSCYALRNRPAPSSLPPLSDRPSFVLDRSPAAAHPTAVIFDLTG